jgi:hypothetical protein
MELSLITPSDRPRIGLDLTCSECGTTFHPHQLAEGVEVLCNRCYEAQFDRAGDLVFAGLPGEATPRGVKAA